jgi:integrase
MSTFDRATALAAARTTLAALGLTAQDLLDEGGGEGVTFGDFVKSSVLPALSKGKRKAWSTYAATAVNGLPGLCGCFCDECLGAFRGDSQWVACNCVATGECNCAVRHLTAGPVETTSCLEHCMGLAEREFAAITISQLEHLSHWVQLRAEKRTASRNRKLALEGSPQFTYKGHSAVEHLRGFLSFAYKMARGDRTTGITLNVALDMSRFSRPTVQKRSYSADRLEELWQALYTSGSNDVELDTYAVSFFLETGGRRSAPVKMRIGDLLASEMKVRMGEKADKIDEQPISENLLEALLRHAIERGDVILRAPTDFKPEEFTLSDVTSGRITLRPEAPVFYYRQPLRSKADDGSVTFRPHPLTSRRFDSLWKRLKRELPWLDALHGRPHDLRKTVGTLIDRAYGHATSRAFLRHKEADVTDIYTMAGEDEVKRAHQWLTGTGEWH